LIDDEFIMKMKRLEQDLVISQPEFLDLIPSCKVLCPRFSKTRHSLTLTMSSTFCMYISALLWFFYWKCMFNSFFYRKTKGKCWHCLQTIKNDAWSEAT